MGASLHPERVHVPPCLPATKTPRLKAPTKQYPRTRKSRGRRRSKRSSWSLSYRIRRVGTAWYVEHTSSAHGAAMLASSPLPASTHCVGTSRGCLARSRRVRPDRSFGLVAESFEGNVALRWLGSAGRAQSAANVCLLASINRARSRPPWVPLFTVMDARLLHSGVATIYWVAFRATSGR